MSYRHNVQVAKGSKQYKLVYAAPLLDLLDIENSDEVVWNSDTISWVRGTHFYAWPGPLPLMFQVIYRNRAAYNGSMFGLSGKTYVSQTFKDEYEKRELSGLSFFAIPRTTPPENFLPFIK